MTAVKAIRAKCLDCMCWNAAEVKRCPMETCPLHPYRMGKNPNIRLTDEQRAARAATMRKTRMEQLRKKAEAPAGV